MLSCFRLRHKICYKEKKNLFFILKITKKKNILKALYFLFLRIKIVFFLLLNTFSYFLVLLFEYGLILFWAFNNRWWMQ